MGISRRTAPFKDKRTEGLHHFSKSSLMTTRRIKDLLLAPLLITLNKCSSQNVLQATYHYGNPSL